jgi:hypothetical protein
MIDMGWLLEAAPALKSAKKILVLHGTDWAAEKMSQACVQAGVSARTVLYRPHLPLSYGTHHSKVCCWVPPLPDVTFGAF